MIKSQKAVFEKVEPQFGSSFRYQTFDHSTPNKNNNFWHYHPEIELVYISSGSGKRQIGSHVSYYRQGDLILIGSIPFLVGCNMSMHNQSNTRSNFEAIT